MALVYTLLLEASSTWSTAPRSGPIPLCAVIFHLFPPAHCVQDAHCICLLRLLLATLPGWNVLSPLPLLYSFLPSSPCLPVTEYCLTGALMLLYLFQLSLPFALSPQRIGRPLSSLSTGHLHSPLSLSFHVVKCNLWTTRWLIMGECHLPFE